MTDMDYPFDASRNAYIQKRYRSPIVIERTEPKLGDIVLTGTGSYRHGMEPTKAEREDYTTWPEEDTASCPPLWQWAAMGLCLGALIVYAIIHA